MSYTIVLTLTNMAKTPDRYSKVNCLAKFTHQPLNLTPLYTPISPRD